MIINKKQVRGRFLRAASTYDGQAVIQHRVAARLLALLRESGCQHPASALEIGSCTGLLTQQLVNGYPCLEKLYVNDLVEEFGQRVAQRLQGRVAEFVFMGGDIETLALPGGQDLIISSSTFHWLADLPSFFKKLRQALKLEGFLAFAMYGPENLREIRAITGVGLDYPGPERVAAMLDPGFRLVARDERPEIIHFPEPRALLQHLRQTGVNSLQRRAWTKKKLQGFVREYAERFSDEHGVFVTYHPMYFIARPR